MTTKPVVGWPMSSELATPADRGAPSANRVVWAALRRGLRPVVRSPWWIRITLLYLVTRLFSFAVFSAAAMQQGPNPWFAPKPDYWHFIGIWDGEWYQRIFQGFYPQEIPRGADGVAKENAWAFYPLFPLLVRGIWSVTGLDWLILAPIVATVAGLAASLMIYKLFRLFASTVTATWAVAFILVFPVSPILQVPYAESLNLFLLAAALYTVIKHRYFLALPLVAFSALSRPIGVAFAGFVFLHLLFRLLERPNPAGSRTAGETGTGRSTSWRSLPRRWREIPSAQRWGGACLLLVSTLVAFAWPLIAWWVTGDLKAYTETETAWRGGPLILFMPWFDTSVQLFGPVFGLLAPFGLVLAALLYFNSTAVRKLGLDLRLWCLCYFLYLLAVLHPQTSTFRLLLPLFPLALAAAFISRSRAFRGAVLVFFLLLQIVWVVWLWAWAPLPGGGDYPP